MIGTDIRYLVERPEGQREDGRWEDVGAAGGCDIHTSGALVFRDESGVPVVTYAPHAWLTVVTA